MCVEVANLCLNFGQKNILSDLSFTLEQGQIACLLGHSGCGKTTMLRALAGFEMPSSGKIMVENQCLFERTNQKNSVVPAHQRKIGMVFQDYALFPHLTVADNIGFGLDKWDKTKKAARINELLHLVELSDFGERYPHELSGGQAQRVALARAFAPSPRLILLDEPFSNLDVDLRASLSRQVRKLLKATNTTAILVTHDQAEAFAVADVIGVMSGGKLLQWASPDILYQYPSCQIVAKFIGDGALLPVVACDELGAITDCCRIACDNVALYDGTSDCQILIRPQDVLLSTQKTDTHTLQGTVSDKEFFGAYWRYHVSLFGQTVFAHAPLQYTLQTDQTVYIHIQKGWLVNRSKKPI